MTRAQLQAKFELDLRNNTTGLITPAVLRDNFGTLADIIYPLTVNDFTDWNQKFNRSYNIINAVTDAMPVIDLLDAAEGASVSFVNDGLTPPQFTGGQYIGIEGNVHYPGALNQIVMTHRSGKIYVAMWRIDRITTPSPLTIAGASSHNIGDVITPDYVINLKSIQWQISDDNITFADISGATSATYTLISGQEDKYIRFQAIYEDDTQMFETDELTSNSKVINAVIELVPNGYNMSDVAPADGRADGVIVSGSSTSTVPTFAVVNDGANGFTGGYQRVSATGTANACFTSILLDAIYNATQNLKVNTSYRIKVKYRASAAFRLMQSGGSVWQSLTNNTGGAILGGNQLNLAANTGAAIEVSCDILSNVSVENYPQLRFQANQASPEFYEFQISVIEL